MATRMKSAPRKPARKRKAVKRTATKSRRGRSKSPRASRRPARKRADGTRKPGRQPRKKRSGRREAPIPRKSGAAGAAIARARAAEVQPVGGEGKSAATGRMRAVPPRELQPPQARPAGLTREQRKKSTNEEGFGFKQIEERLDTERAAVQRGTTSGRSGIAAERRRAIPDYEDEVKEGGVENAAGYVDYDRQERTADEEPEVDIEAPAAAEEE